MNDGQSTRYEIQQFESSAANDSRMAAEMNAMAAEGWSVHTLVPMGLLWYVLYERTAEETDPTPS